MRLTLSSEAVRNAVMTNENGQVLYRTFHPLKLGLSQGTTTIEKIKPNDDPMDVHDRFEVLAKIERHFNDVLGVSNAWPGASIGRIHSATWHPWTKTGPDGLPYRWDMHRDTVMLSRNDQTRAELARYHRATLGIIGPKRRPYLDISPEVVHMLDMIVDTFVYTEKLHMDKERAAQRDSGGGP